MQMPEKKVRVRFRHAVDGYSRGDEVVLTDEKALHYVAGRCAVVLEEVVERAVVVPEEARPAQAPRGRAK